MRRVKVKVPLEECKLRALRHLDTDRRTLYRPSEIAHSIWPDAEFRAQGAGIAASRILSLLRDEGLARWQHDHVGKFEDWGWAITGAGRAHLRRI